MAPELEQKNVLCDLFDDPVSPQAAAPKLAAVTLPLSLPDQDDKDEVEEAVTRIERLRNYIIDRRYTAFLLFSVWLRLQVSSWHDGTLDREFK
jgi:hypothetical protein